MVSAAKIDSAGFELFGPVIDHATVDRLSETIFRDGVPGTRCLLDEPVVRDVALTVRRKMSVAGCIAPGSVAIQAIAFDKTPAANWKVTWHQDLMFPFAQPVMTAGFDLPSKKDGIDYARPPRSILECLLAVRIHLDDCDETNGPLRVSAGTHRLGIIPSASIARTVAQHGEQVCLAEIGEALLMKPLTLHASSQATAPQHRRVLHLVYYSGPALPEPWHRAV